MTSRAPDIVPENRDTRWLLLVLAAMGGFMALAILASLATIKSASSWSHSLDNKAMIQLRPVSEISPEQQLANTLALLRDAPAVRQVTPMDTSDAAELLEPWLGRGDLLDGLPIPQLVAVELRQSPQQASAQLEPLIAAISAVPGATIDTFGFAKRNLLRLTRAIHLVMFAVVACIFAATTAVIIFATRANLTIHREIVTVLHLMGAHDRFIAAEFERHFAWLGVRAGLAGVAVTLLIALVFVWLAPSVTNTGVDRFLPANLLSVPDLIALLIVPVVLAATGWYTARLTVLGTLRRQLR